ncbi:MAG: hypothetical protein KGM42_21445, partial [Hyphomicrobiales bacterium]|nr:hypothetical protein [Hyphomicrobiales bacterium]
GVALRSWQDVMQVRLHDPSCDATFGAHEIEQICLERRVRAVHGRRIEKRTKRSLDLSPISARDMGQDIADVRMDAEGD